MQAVVKPVTPTSQARGVRGYLAYKDRGWYILGYLLLAIIALWTVLPVYWMLVTSVKPDAAAYDVQTSIIPREMTLQHYNSMIFHSQFPVFFRNSFLVAAGTTLISTFVAAMAAYSLVRLRFAGRTAVARLLIYSYLAPASVLFIPIFVMMVKLHLTNSMPGLVLSYLTFTVPFCTWMLMGYLRSVPLELEEAALVDGATRWQALWRIILPLAAPAVVVVAVFSFTLSWNEFLYALVLVQNQSVMTAPVGLAFLQVGDVFYWGEMMAAASFMSIPPLLLYFFGQRWVVAGWTVGAVKG